LEKGRERFEQFVGSAWTLINRYDPETKHFENEEMKKDEAVFKELKKETLRRSLELLRQTPLWSQEWSSRTRNASSPFFFFFCSLLFFNPFFLTFILHSV
jgi:lysyl-tRNA synthetase class I